MHIAFIPYGARLEVERLLRDMESQKMKLKLTKEGEPDKGVFINGQIRLLPFGVIEYVFPREYQDIVFNTMCKGTAPNRYGIPKIFQTMFQKALKLKKIPEYKEEEKFLWAIDHVMIMPVGLREDEDLVEVKDMGYKGWLHEAI